jgi:hypothetical protein
MRFQDARPLLEYMTSRGCKAASREMLPRTLPIPATREARLAPGVSVYISEVTNSKRHKNTNAADADA